MLKLVNCEHWSSINCWAGFEVYTFSTYFCYTRNILSKFIVTTTFPFLRPTVALQTCQTVKRPSSDYVLVVCNEKNHVLTKGAKNVPITNMVTCWTYIFDIMKVQHIFHSTSIVPRILWLNVVFCSKNSRLTCISYSCECLVDITSCILAEDESKLDADHTISPLKEPLKKKGNDITNPYPNFKVCTHHTTETDHVDQLLW